MAGQGRQCVICKTLWGKPHPTTSRIVEYLIVNDANDALICLDCVSLCVPIMAENVGKTVDKRMQD